MGNTFGHTFRVTTFGESHGGGVGGVVDGLPAGVRVDRDRVQTWLDRRRPGQSALASPRQEKDRVELLSGLENGVSLGTPIAFVVRNADARPDHYQDVARVFRPSHADYTTEAKYGRRATSGGGRASARETIGRVAAAAIAEALLTALYPQLAVVAWVAQVKDVEADCDAASVTREAVEAHPTRCPDQQAREAMQAVILDAKARGDSVGGVIGAAVRQAPVGLGEPVFDKLEARLAAAMMSLPAAKGFEVGSGFSGTRLFGSEHNDAFVTREDGRIGTATNRSGGIQGGISNGETIALRVAFKPVSTIFRPQATVDSEGQPATFAPQAGRHDPCVLPRAVPMVEAMTLLVLADHVLRLRSSRLRWEA